MQAPRAGGADDLKQISGIGPKLEETLNAHGYYHFDQIAAWTPAEVAWVDATLPGVGGRAGRDNWVAQARAQAAH
ncbi:NADH-ubiquinone oxidoreductase chain E [Salipiger mucosus DSM 16094]|uniref:NADH-ubiquinone oxidoreductase chain E n=1 Tax=Salipiger mucosus DSM 16094 TaxID=1123237 RepID=S9RDM1_9RHOB|nr:NADH-ubiquinone oxidoreductase chain E [Salipiger mucosus DSM 16094]